ncbi:MAG: hypothetical protein M5U26_06400 [Planctomycetota bacterium]|nr:hypothetical protein [Planctomycetota bacterium]
MNDHQKKVLDLLAEGKISADEAAKLLERLNRPASGESCRADGVDEAGQPRERTGRRRPRYLRVTSYDHGGEKLDVRVPLSLLTGGIRLSALLPTEAREVLREKGFDTPDFSRMSSEELLDAMADLNVNLKGPRGETLRVFCE